MHSGIEQKPEEGMNVFQDTQDISKEGFKVIEGKNCQPRSDSSIKKDHPNNCEFGGIEDLAEYTKIPGEENKFGTYNGGIKVFQPKQGAKGKRTERGRNRREFIGKVKHIISSNLNIPVDDGKKKDFGKGVEK